MTIESNQRHQWYGIATTLLLFFVLFFLFWFFAFLFLYIVGSWFLKWPLQTFLGLFIPQKGLGFGFFVLCIGRRVECNFIMCAVQLVYSSVFLSHFVSCRFLPDMNRRTSSIQFELQKAIGDESQSTDRNTHTLDQTKHTKCNKNTIIFEIRTVFFSARIGWERASGRSYSAKIIENYILAAKCVKLKHRTQRPKRVNESNKITHTLTHRWTRYSTHNVCSITYWLRSILIHNLWDWKSLVNGSNYHLLCFSLSVLTLSHLLQQLFFIFLSTRAYLRLERFLWHQ